MVIVVDGIRLSENELSNAILSTIPIDTVDRIEITRGGNSVLYGDGATGGVINVITKRPRKQATHGTVFAEAGQFKDGELRASVAQSWNDFAIDGTVDTQRTDNYRVNNDFKQTHVSAGAQWYSDEGRMGVRYEGARQDQHFAGSLTEVQFLADPRQSMTPKDNGTLDTDRLTAFIQRRVAGIDLAADLSYRTKTVKAAYYDYKKPFASPFTSEYESKQTQFSPRARQLSTVAGKFNEIVAGVDLIQWNRTTANDYSAADATQHSKALYLRDELRFDAEHEGRLAAGVRRELFAKDASDPKSFPATSYNVVQGLNAWELQASYAPVAKFDLYARAGQSYRVVNSDESGYSADLNKPLLPQVSHDIELGASYGDTSRKVTVRAFRNNLTNEIFLDPTLNFGFGYNTNLDPTKRQGVEVDAEARVAADWSLSGHYQHVNATFTEGVHNGKELMLVPKNLLSVRLAWVSADGQSADVGAQWVDSQRYGDDLNNRCALMPAFTTFDARYARKFGAWELALAGSNLTDKHYFSQAFSCKDGVNGGIYSADGRQLKVSARYDF
jgi:iron complex outermembrane receptor protein